MKQHTQESYRKVWNGMRVIMDAQSLSIKMMKKELLAKKSIQLISHKSVKVIVSSILAIEKH